MKNATSRTVYTALSTSITRQANGGKTTVMNRTALPLALLTRAAHAASLSRDSARQTQLTGLTAQHAPPVCDPADPSMPMSAPMPVKFQG
jgi:hypothetical protein